MEASAAVSVILVTHARIADLLVQLGGDETRDLFRACSRGRYRI
jgi:hypothetical protein